MKMGLVEMVREDMGWIVRWEPLEGCCEYGHDPSGSRASFLC